MLVITPQGALPTATAVIVDVVSDAAGAVLVVDLLYVDSGDAGDIARLMRSLRRAMRSDWTVVVVNAPQNVRMALKVVGVSNVDTSERDLPV